MSERENIQKSNTSVTKETNIPPTAKVQSVLKHEELIEYMYHNIRFEEMPFHTDPLYDHRQIYTHDTAHIEYGLY